MPVLLKDKYTSLENQYFPNYVMIHRKYTEVFAGYRKARNALLGIALFAFVLGIIGFVVACYS